MGGSDSLRLEWGRLVHVAPLGSNSWPFPVLSGTAVFCEIAQLSPHFLVMCYMYVSPGFNRSCVLYATSLKFVHVNQRSFSQEIVSELALGVYSVAISP